jgi:lipooligosaccharide transport system ATP-binding protein
MNIVSARELTKDYGAFRAVDSIDFDILKGECFGFLGPNGAGKTTVMKTIYCFMPPTSGKVTVFGMDATEKQSGIKARIGVMPQENNLDPDLSVLENLIVYARYFDIPQKKSLPKALELFGFVDLKDKAGVKIDQLSGGMKHRLLLARSIINDPDLLVLDEPTTGLDPHNRHSVWDLLLRLKADGMTIVLTTHYMEEAEKLCDHVAIMDSGKIVATGAPKDLMAAHGGNLEDVYLKITGRRLEY